MNLIKQWRLEHNVTQEEMAWLMKTSQPYVSQLENNTEANPTIGTLNSVAAAISEATGKNLKVKIELVEESEKHHE